MPLHVRPIAISVAVVCFFGLGMVGWASSLAPFTCCKRALAGAVLAYIAAALAVKAINAILTSAMITSQMNQRKREGSSDGN